MERVGGSISRDSILLAAKSLLVCLRLFSLRPMSSAADQFAKFKSVLATPEVPMLGPQRREGTMGKTDLLGRLELYFGENKTPEIPRELLRSAALLWHDQLDASHTLSQGIDTPEGSWLHGIMHRREPDYGNARYWFHRVGEHTAFPKLTGRVAEFTGRRQPWDPFAFIDECEQAEQGRDAQAVWVLRRIQAAEFEVLVEHIFANCS